MKLAEVEKRYASGGADAFEGPLREALTLGAAALAKDPAQIGAQIAGRLSPTLSPEIAALIEEARARPLVPLAASLEKPGGPLVRTLEGHGNFVGSLQWMPDGKTLLSSSEDGTIRVWDPATGALRATLGEHGSAVNCIALNRAGTRLVSASDDRTIKVWDTATWRVLRTITGHENYVSKVVVTATDGLLSTSKDATARLWDLETGKLFATFPFKQWITEAAITPDGFVAVVASTDNVMKVYDVEHAKEIRTLVDASAGFLVIPGFDLFIPGKNRSGVGHESAPHDMVFAPDGKTLLSVQKEVIAWDIESGKEKARYGSFAWTVNALAADTRGFLWLGGSGITVLDAAGNEVARLDGHTEEVTSLALSPDGRTLASGSKDTTVRLWDVDRALAAGKSVRHTNGVAATRFSPDGTIALTGAHDGTARTWDAKTGAARHLLAHGSDPFVSVVAFTPDGARIVTTSHDGTLAVWDARSGARLHDAKQESGLYSFTQLAVLPGGRQAVAGEVGDRGLTLWELEGGTAPIVLAGATKFAQSLALTRDGARAVVTTYADENVPGKVQVWDLAARALAAEAEAPGPFYYPMLVLSKDEARAFAAGSNGRFDVWDVAQAPRLVATAAGVEADGWPIALAVLPDGTVLRAAAPEATTILRFLRADGTLVRTAEIAHGSNRGFSLTADGTRAALAHEDSVVLVEIATGAILARFVADSSIDSIALSPDGTRLLAGERSGRVHLLTT